MLFLKSVVRKFLRRLSITKSKFRILNLFFCFLFSAFCFLYLPCNAANAATVTIAWDKISESNILGYKMHYGTTSGSYDFSVDVGTSNSCTISKIEPDQTYYFAATAYNEIGESDFSEELVYSVSSEPDPSDEHLNEVIIDNGDEGTFSNGRWRISSGPNPYGDESLYSQDRGSRYTFEATLGGNYVVSLRWTEHSSRCSQVPVEIYDGDTLLETIEVNQQTNGGQWNELGEYLFKSTARVVVASNGNCSTGVDALEIVSNDVRSTSPSLYQIVSSAGSNGNVTPSGEVTVSAGASASYTIQPDANYHIADVKVDGTSVGPVTSYSFNNLDADHTINVSFDADAVADDNSPTRWWQRYRYSQ